MPTKPSVVSILFSNRWRVREGGPQRALHRLSSRQRGSASPARLRAGVGREPHGM